jgi:hypothetical protein
LCFEFCVLEGVTFTIFGEIIEFFRVNQVVTKFLRNLAFQTV